MKAVVSTSSYDPIGVIELELLEADTDYGEIKRRVNRVATLDGGAAFNDYGYSDADRTFKLVWKSDLDIDTKIQRLVKFNPLLNISTPDGYYSAAPESYVTTKEQSTLTLLVKSKLSE